MNKIDGYDVVITKGTPRFRLNNKLIKRELVPVAVQNELISIAMDKDAARTVAPAPDVSATYTEEQPTSAPVELPDEEMVENPYVESLAAGAPEEFPVVNMSDPTVDPHSQKFTELELELLQENDALKRKVDELTHEAVSTGNSAQALGKQLLDEYGVYSALAPRDPQIGDIHPFTLRPMNRYDVGLAYAERKKSVGQEVQPYVPTPEPQANEPDNGGFPSFQDRTGVSFETQTSATMKHHTNDPISDEATAEPNLRGTTIRPYW